MNPRRRAQARAARLCLVDRGGRRYQRWDSGELVSPSRQIEKRLGLSGRQLRKWRSVQRAALRKNEEGRAA